MTAAVAKSGVAIIVALWVAACSGTTANEPSNDSQAEDVSRYAVTATVTRPGSEPFQRTMTLSPKSGAKARGITSVEGEVVATIEMTFVADETDRVGDIPLSTWPYEVWRHNSSYYIAKGGIAFQEIHPVQGDFVTAAIDSIAEDAQKRLAEYLDASADILRE